jgi:hypothetical protein
MGCGGYNISRKVGALLASCLYGIHIDVMTMFSFIHMVQFFMYRIVPFCTLQFANF